MKRRDALLLGLSAALPSFGARAQQWPSRPITMVYPFGAGAADGLGRAMALALEVNLGNPVVMEHRPGGGGVIGGQIVARARPDGHTLMYSTSSTIASLPELVNNLPYNPLQAFDPVVWIGDFPLWLFIRSELPIKTIKDLITYAKANPGKLNMAVATNVAKVYAAYLERDEKISFTKVPYKTDPDSVADVLAGRIDIFWATGQWLEYVNSGKLRALVVSTSRRSTATPDVPTLAESGLSPTPFSASVGMVAPAGTPRPIIERMNRILNEAKRTREDFKKAMAFLRVVEAPDNGPEEFRTIWTKEAAQWKVAVPLAGLEKQ